MAIMPKWICKVSRSGYQRRVTLPKGLIVWRGWHDVKYVMFEDDGENPVTVREFIHAESLKDEGSRNKGGSDR